MFGQLRPSSIFQHLLNTGQLVGRLKNNYCYSYTTGDGIGRNKKAPYTASLTADGRGDAEATQESGGGDDADYNAAENEYSDSSVPSMPSYYYYYYYDESGIDICNELSL